MKMVEFTCENLNFLIFLIKIVYPHYKSLSFLIYMIYNYCEIKKQELVYEIKVVSGDFIKKCSDICDTNNTIIINEKCPLNYPKLALIYTNFNGETIVRKVFVICRKLEKNDSQTRQVFISPNLSYNLKSPTTCSLKILKENRLNFAEEVELALINTPNDWSNYTIDLCLKAYFQVPKVVAKGDLIEISLNEYGKEAFYTSNKILNIDDSLYFKCTNILIANNSFCCFCAVGKTSVRQIANVQSFIPQLNCEAILPYPSAFNTSIEDLKRTLNPFVHKSTQTNFKPTFLLEGRKGCGKSLIIQALANYFAMNLYTISNFDVSANVYAQNETKLRNVFFGAKLCAPCILQIKNFENFGKNNEGQYDERLINHFQQEVENFFRNNNFPVILFCSSNDKSIPLQLKRIFLKIMEIKAPNDVERESILEWVIQSCNISNSNFDFLNKIANKTHGFLFEDLRALTRFALTDYYYNNNNNNNNDVNVGGEMENCFLKALDFMQSNYNESLGAPKVPKVKWSDVGGLTDIKDEIIKTIKLPLKHPKLLVNSGLKRSGILLYGPPGTGKTLIAKAVATECGLCFLSVKGPELLNMYVGQSEQNVREVFERAREASPCIIFFDELDSLAPNRGSSGDSGGVMDRVVSQLLAEMDGLNQTGTIFIIGATNRPDLIDPALLRPGRFDKLLYVGPCLDQNSKIAVLKALTRKFRLSEDCLVEKIVDLCPSGFSGADFYGLCSNAWMTSVRKLITSIENGKMKTNLTSEDIIVSLEDFQLAIKNIRPSIKQEDLEYFNKLKQELS